MASKIRFQTSLDASKAVFQDTVPWMCKFALLSFQSSRLLDYITLCADYLQLISQAFLNNSIMFRPVDERNSLLHKIFVSPFEPFTPGRFFFVFDSWSLNCLIVLPILAALLVLRTLLFIYCLIKANTQRKETGILFKIWRYVFSLQSRVIYILVSSTWIFVSMKAIRGETGLTDQQNSILVIICVIMTVADYAFTLILSIYFDCIIPRKSMLASKSTAVPVMNLTQKFCSQVLVFIFSKHDETFVWVISAVNLVFSLVRNYRFFTSFPPYKLKAVYSEAAFLALVTALHLACFVRCIARTTKNNEDNTCFIVIMWIILSILLVKLAIFYVNRMILNLVTKFDEKRSPEMKINKLLIIRNLFKKNQMPTEISENCSQVYLLNTIVRGNFQKVFGIVKDDEEGLKNQENVYKKNDQLFVGYLESLLSDFPQNKFVKLYAAYFYAKKLKMYGQSMRLLHDLQNSSSLKMKFNSLLLINDIQGIVRRNYRSSESGPSLDLFTYTRCLSKALKLKLNIVEQAKFQMEIYKENLKTKNLARVLVDGDKVVDYRKKIKIQFKELRNYLPDYYVQPLLLYAQYNLVLNHSMSAYFTLMKAWTAKSQKYNKFFCSDELVRENIFHEDSGFMIVSGQKKDLGIIKYCSKELQKVYGEKIVGQNFVVVFPNLMRLSNSNVIADSLDSDNAHFNKTEEKLCVDKDGFLFLVSNHLNISPVLTEGLNFYLVSRKCKTQKDYMMITNDGHIEDYSRSIAEKLGLPLDGGANSHSKLTISQVCPELNLVNNSLNIVLFNKKESSTENVKSSITPKASLTGANLNVLTKFQGFSQSFNAKKPIKDQSNVEMERAQKIFHDYTVDGKEVTFFPLTQKGSEVRNMRFQQEGLIYHCKISNFEIEEGRLLTLEEMSSGYDDLSSEANNNQPTTMRELKAPTPGTPSNFKGINRQVTVGNFRPSQTFFRKIQHSRGGSHTVSQFTSEEEKEGGWVDFEVLMSASGTERQLVFGSTALQGRITSDDTILPSTERNIVIGNTPRHAAKLNNIAKNRRTNLLGTVSGAVEEQSESREVVVVKDNKKSSIASKSKHDTQEKISKYFEMAITTKFYSNRYKFLSILVFVIFLGLLISMIKLGDTLNSDLALIHGRTEVLKSLQIENVLIPAVHRNMRLLSGFASGQLSTSDYSASFQIPAILSSMGVQLSLMTQNNQIFLSNVGELDERNRGRIFKEDVRVYYNGFEDSSEIFEKFNVIGALQKILSFELKAFDLSKINPVQAVSDYKVIMRNALNDFLVMNQQKVDEITLFSLQNQGNVFERMFNNAYATVAVLGILAAIYIGIMVKLYQRERRNLVAFAGLNSKRVQAVEAKITAFMKLIENEEELEPIQNIIDAESYSVKGDSIEKPAEISRSKGSDISTRSILVKYILYTVYLMSVLFIIMGLVFVNCVEARNSINNLNLNIVRLMHVLKAVSRINLSMTTPVEMFVTNDSTLVENMTPSLKLQELIKELSTIQSALINSFDQQDGSEDETIHHILYRDACSALTLTPQIQVCKKLTAGAGIGYSSGYIQIIDYLRTVLQGVANQYRQSDKSPTSLNALLKTYVNTKMAPFLVIIPISQTFGELLGADFYDQIDRARTQNTVLSFTLYIFLVGLCFALYLAVLRKIGESDNRFKQVLGVFPPKLIFSNFVLKTYLLNTSAGILSSVINKI